MGPGTVIDLQSHRIALEREETDVEDDVWFQDHHTSENQEHTPHDVLPLPQRRTTS